MSTQNQFNNESDVVNSLIQKSRETDVIRNHLSQSELSDYTQMTQSQILNEFKNKAKRDGNL